MSRFRCAQLDWTVIYLRGQSRSEMPHPGFPIVGIGASAGGLEAFDARFRACRVASHSQNEQ